MSRRNLINAAENSAWRKRAPIGKDLFQSLGIDLGLDAAGGQDCLDLRSKNERPITDGIKKRSHADSVPRHEDTLFSRVPNGECELPVQPLGALLAPFFV